MPSGWFLLFHAETATLKPERLPRQQLTQHNGTEFRFISHFTPNKHVFFLS
jgi:hypothetical protein